MITKVTFSAFLGREGVLLALLRGLRGGGGGYNLKTDISSSGLHKCQHFGGTLILCLPSKFPGVKS